YSRPRHPPHPHSFPTRRSSDLNLAAQAVERREHDRMRRVVDDEVDAGQVLERADVASLAADDAPLHVVGRKLHDGNGRLGGMARSEEHTSELQSLAYLVCRLLL